ncbi:MAG: sigma-70 family RNA polymerase sigma factor [Myxococcales bacterium]|nr:sigma-70 family RNA polymerase sigma factor [Myxococcales bacterium]
MDAPPPIDPEVVRVLVDNHRRFLDFLTPRVASREVAEDILQSAMARGLARGGAIRDQESAVAWFYRLLRNAVTDHYRRQGAERRALAHHAVEVEVPEAEMERAVCRCFEGLLPTLHEDYAAILRAVDLGGQSVADFAAGADITANNTRVRLHRARQALRKQLERMCGTCAVHGCLDCACGAGGASPHLH